METPEEREIVTGLRIRVVTAPYFFATKLEAFRGRGHGDYLTSQDLEDIVTVVDGRPELLEELRAASQDVRSYIATDIRGLLETEQFADALPGYLLPDEASQGRIGILLARLGEISKL